MFKIYTFTKSIVVNVKVFQRFSVDENKIFFDADITYACITVLY